MSGTTEPKETEVEGYSSGATLILESKNQTAEQKQKFTAEVDRLANNIKDMPGRDRVAAVHQAVNAYMDSQLKNVKISCRAGCAWCCHSPVQATEDEVDILLEEAGRQGVEVDVDRLLLQADKGRELDWWQNTAPENSKCVFLGPDNSCQVYEKRPAACRTHVVTSNPDLCQPWNNSKEVETDFKKYVVPTAEVVASALYKSSKLGFLSAMLYRRSLTTEEAK